MTGDSRGQEASLAPAQSILPPPTATILDSIADGVFTVDHDWRVTFFNRAAEDITGIPAAEALGRPGCEDYGFEAGGGAVFPRRKAKPGRRPQGYGSLVGGNRQATGNG